MFFTLYYNESPKCHVYRYIFDNNVLQFYFDRPLNYIYQPYICKMRISAHNLNIETGRFYNLDRHERVCSIRGGFRGGVRGVRPPPPLKFAKHMLYNVN